MKTTIDCLECGRPITRGVHEFSQSIYGYSLCLKDQCMITESGASGQAVDLYLALKSRNFPVVLNHFDGYQHADIALPGKLHIEVNNPFQDNAAQVYREDYPPEQHVPTIFISNSSLENTDTFNHIVEEVTKACRVMLKNRMLPECFIPFTISQLQ
jgi:hypothetical protein